ncbi:hypothetical protein CJP72_15445 [Citrobacter sp. NCU1]|uniref:hypothetical protein n=1 Tax=Citrobacter sp. NCU1 TaxID=2026683 RepID=UPI001391D012|nr:hypothetical protein [Citrobacter sp. NCU1]NDO82107.1 hypothetical protein [Citrobacter sp. NCU1]
MKKFETFNLDTVPFTDAVNIIFLEPEELLQGIYNELIDKGIPDFIALPATKKSVEISRAEIIKTLKRVFDNTTDVSAWEPK